MADVAVDNGASDPDQLNSYMTTRFTYKRTIFLGLHDLHKVMFGVQYFGVTHEG